MALHYIALQPRALTSLPTLVTPTTAPAATITHITDLLLKAITPGISIAVTPTLLTLQIAAYMQGYRFGCTIVQTCQCFV